MLLNKILIKKENEKIKPQDQNRGFEDDGSVDYYNAPYHTWGKTFDYRITLEVDPSE